MDAAEDDLNLGLSKDCVGFEHDGVISKLLQSFYFIAREPHSELFRRRAAAATINNPKLMYPKRELWKFRNPRNKKFMIGLYWIEPSHAKTRFKWAASVPVLDAINNHRFILLNT